MPVTPTTVPVQLLRAPLPSAPDPFVIDCAECEYQHTRVCDDCVVSFIVDRHPDDAVVVDVDEARAVRMLEHAGLVPGVRHSRRAG